MLADEDFLTDYDEQEKELKKLRRKIKKGESPEWMIEALEAMHGAYPEGQSLRYRSSTNNEDLPNFSGAGLYDSKTQKPEETEDDGIDKSMKQVFASLWNFRAFVEREFYRIDHKRTAMGILVHPNYTDELVNGVAVSFDPLYGKAGHHYVNSQVGEDLVTNPEAYSLPEGLLLKSDGSYVILHYSNRGERMRLLMRDSQVRQLRRHLDTIHDHFDGLYDSEPYAIEIEFKITSEDRLAIKQARPWVFGGVDGDVPPPPPTPTPDPLPTPPPPPNTPATGLPTITGTAQVGETLTADITGISDDDGLDNAVFAYQWLADDAEIDSATASSYTLVAADAGKAIKVRVSFTDDGGNDEQLTSAVTGAVVAAEVAAVVVEPPLTATIHDAPSSHNGQDAFTFELRFSEDPEPDFSYTTVRDHAFTVTGGSVTYVRRLEPGKNVRWEITVTPGSSADVAIALNATTDCSAQGAICTEDGRKLSGGLLLAVPGPNTPATGLPTITGAAQVGETLTADTTGISDGDGLDNATFAYQWLADDAEISGATASTYTLADDDEGKAIKVRVSFTDDGGNDEQLTSAATSAVAAVPPPPNTPATGAPTITGTAQVGETLTADITGISDGDGLDNAVFAYQWLADDAEINGATASTYTLADEDAGKVIKVMVSLTDDAGNDEQLTSAVTGAVTAAVVTPPLTASVHNVPSSHNGQDAFTFELRFGEAPEPDFSYRTVWDHAFTVTEGSVTYVRRLEPGKNVRWEVTVTPDSSADVAIALNATTDCEAVGAICTSDGERLSASISAIVSGPVPVGTVPVAVIVSGTTPVAEGATVSFTISLNRAAPTALSVAVSVADAGGVLSVAAPRSVAFATSDNSKTITLPTRDDNAIKTASTVTVSLATGSGYTLGTATSASVSVTDNDTAVWTVSAQPTEIAEGGSSTITLAVANGKTFAANQTVSLAVSGTVSGSDYSLSATELTLPAGASSVTATVTARDDASVESDETVIVTAIHDGQPIGSATVTIEANDVAVWTVSAQSTEIAEGGSSTITLAGQRQDLRRQPDCQPGRLRYCVRFRLQPFCHGAHPPGGCKLGHGYRHRQGRRQR